MKIIYKSAVNKKHRGPPAGFRQNKTPSTFRNVIIVILLLISKIKQKPKTIIIITAILIHVLQHSHIVFKLGSVVFSNVLNLFLCFNSSHFCSARLHLFVQ